MSTLKQTKTMTGSTSSSLWTWKQVVYEYFDDDYITNNRSRIVVESYLGRPAGQSTQSFGGTASIDITCDGESRSTSKSWNYGANQIAGGGWFLIQSETFYPKHNDDGTKKITISSSLSTSAFNPNSASASGELTLTTIPRTTPCPNLDGYIEGSAPIALNPASTSFKHRIYYSYNGKTGYYPGSSSFFGASGSLPLDTSFYSYTSGKIGTGTITLYTYSSDGSLIGSTTGTMTVRCSANKCTPTIWATIVDSNSTTKNLTGDNTKLIKGYSNAQITYTINAKNGASIDAKTVNGQTLGSSPYTINNVTTGNFEIYAIDSRGFSRTINITKTLINYVPLTLEFNVFRPTPTGSGISINFQGNYFNGSFGSVSNTLSLSWKYRAKGTSSWTNGGTFTKDTHYTISGNRFYSNGDVVLSDTLFEYQTNYEIAVYYTDKLINTYTIKPVPKGQPVLSWEDQLVNVNGQFVTSDNIFTKDVKCKNLLDIKARPYRSYYADKSVNGDMLTVTGNSSNWVAYLINVKPNTNYTFSVESMNDGIGIYDINVDGYIGGHSISKGTSYTFNTGSHTQITLVFYGNDTYVKPQLEEGSSPTSYTPYTYFGNDYFNTIGEIVTGNVISKNMFDADNINNLVYLTRNNQTFSFDSTFWYGYIGHSYDMDVGRPYTLSFYITATSVSSTYATMVLFYHDGTYTEANINTPRTGYYAMTATPTQEVNYVEFRFFRLNNNTTQRTGSVVNIQLERGDHATKYEKYKKFDCDDLIKFKSVKLTFDTTGASIGDFLNARTTNNYPGINGMSVIGIVPHMVSYGDKNFFTSLHFRDGKVHGQIRVGYKTSDDPILTGWAYIMYINNKYFDDNALT